MVLLEKHRCQRGALESLCGEACEERHERMMQEVREQGPTPHGSEALAVKPIGRRSWDGGMLGRSARGWGFAGAFEGCI